MRFYWVANADVHADDEINDKVSGCGYYDKVSGCG
jgi:hypothetical protein